MDRAQALADALKPDELHRRLDRYAPCVRLVVASKN
jgi:hypothetical protein